MQSRRTLLRTILYLHHRLERGLKEQALPLTLTQYRLLYLIQEGPARSVELATASGLTKPSVGAQIASMQEAGWIERREIEEDKRAASIRITRSGRNVVSTFESSLNGVLEEFLGKEAVARADRELSWLRGVWSAARDAAHDQWILRRSAGKRGRRARAAAGGE